MKKFLIGTLILAVWMFAMSSFGPTLDKASADNGISVGNRVITVVTSTGLFSTGQTYTFGPITYDNLMNSATCDFLSTSGTATGQITIESNLGEGDTMFSTGSITTVASKPTPSIYSIYITGKPFRRLRLTHSLVGGSTNTVTVHCGAIQ